MDPRLAQLRPETIDRLSENAKAEGLSLDAYLNTLLALLNDGTGFWELSEAEFDALMEEFAKGTENVPPLPPNFSRDDIYTDHD
jgi:hypothetical protein